MCLTLLKLNASKRPRASKPSLVSQTASQGGKHPESNMDVKTTVLYLNCSVLFTVLITWI